MTRLALIRHAATAYNDEHRLQGRRDIPLSPAGRAAAGRWRIPPTLADADWLTSPLVRARETARLLGVADAAVEPRLMEMDWGDWEGRTIAELRHRQGAAMAANEALGLDFRPAGGESPREVQARLAPWLAEIAARRRAVCAVTHKGVIRAVFALASGWDMTGEPPARLDWSAAQLFTLAADGSPAVERLNLPLAAP